MDLQQQRMECLKMAFELGGKTDPIVGAAQQLLDFVVRKTSAVHHRTTSRNGGNRGTFG